MSRTPLCAVAFLMFAACGFVETERHAHPGYAEPTFVDMEKRLAS